MTDVQIDRSVRSVDLRIEIGEYYGFDFERRVHESNSNSRAAIYFTRDHLEAIGEDLGMAAKHVRTKRGLTNCIRFACGRDPRAVDGLDWLELVAVVETAEIPISESPYHDLSEPADHEDQSGPAPGGDSDQSGVWAGWGGGSADD